MVVDFSDAGPFLPWLLSSLFYWAIVVVATSALAISFGWLTSAIRRGPFAALVHCFWTAVHGVVDLVMISPRRVRALTWLAVKESLRRWVVVVFGIFVLLILFAGWFLDPGSENPARLYLAFVLSATSYLILGIVWLLSVMSLPTDFSKHTIQTIVTKPVRPSEIVLGRILGFTAIGTALLGIMAVTSYFFVVRGLAHTHELPSRKAMKPVDQTPTLIGKTSEVQDHRHTVTLTPSGEMEVAIERGHVHPVRVHEADGKRTYTLGNAEGMLLARVPVYGKLTFLDRAGNPTMRGISVGKEDDYRSFIEGDSAMAALWTFEGITPERFPRGLLVEMNISVFRSHKGYIEKGIPGNLTLRNPKTRLHVELPIFEAQEYLVTRQIIPLKPETSEGETLDLFQDLTDNGKIEILLRCVEPEQYFGVAQADLYFRARDASFALNFAKGYLGIWMQMVLIITLGVFFSTFLSAPIALLSTLGVAVGGFFHDFLMEVALGKTWGGGPFESILRILTQEGVTAELESTLTVTLVRSLDFPAEKVMYVIASLLPDFGKFDFSDYVTYGFDIPGAMVVRFFFRTLAFAVPVFVAGYFCMKVREVAK